MNVDKYLGKDFNYGETDCYSLVKEFYEDKYGIKLTNYARPDYWWNSGKNFYMDLFKQEGFYLLDDTDSLIEGDIILVALGSNVACHACIYIGDNKVLHHPVNKKSKIDVYKGLWKNYTMGIIRHRSRANVKEEKIKYDFKPKYI